MARHGYALSLDWRPADRSGGSGYPSSARGACQASIPALGVAAALTSTPYGLALPPAAPCPARPLIAPCSHLPEAFGQAVATTSKGKLLGGGPRLPFWIA